MLRIKTVGTFRDVWGYFNENADRRHHAGKPLINSYLSGVFGSIKDHLNSNNFILKQLPFESYEAFLEKSHAVINIFFLTSKNCIVLQVKELFLHRKQGIAICDTS